MDSCGMIMLMLVSVLFIAVPSALARKCYQCDSYQNPGCADANQISQLYTDCANGGGMQYSGQQQFGGAGTGMQQPGQFGQQGGQFPQQMGQVGQPGMGGSSYGSYGSSDRCMKITTVGGMGGIQGSQPRIQRLCGNGNGMAQDGCSWQGNVQVCSCNSNYCNGSSRLSTSSMSALLIAGLATVISYGFRSSL